MPDIVDIVLGFDQEPLLFQVGDNLLTSFIDR